MRHTFAQYSSALILAGSLPLVLSACNSSSSGSSSSPSVRQAQPWPPSCDDPLPAEARQETLTVDIPQDSDPSSNPASATTVYFSVLLPERCPGVSYPLVLHSHGFGESRVTELAENGDLPVDMAFHASLDALPARLPYHGYAVISFDERGHGDSKPANGGGYARLIDPRAETRDAMAILDWAFEHAGELQIQTEPESGIPKDLRVGTLGASYGGGYQMVLAALDPRIDSIVPTDTWHNLRYSTLPGDAVKLAWDGFLSLAVTAQTVIPTPVLETVVNQIGITNPNAGSIRTRNDMLEAASGPTAWPRPVTEEEVDELFSSGGMDYFEARQHAAEMWGFDEEEARLASVPALFLQANRDVLFNLNEAYWNYRYFKNTGADTRLLTNEGGHMNPAVGQVPGDGHCGEVESIGAVVEWFAKTLRNQRSHLFDSLPDICLSVAATEDAETAPSVGVLLDAYPTGALSGKGATPVQADTLSASVPTGAIEPVFVALATIDGNDKVLAGSPRIGSLTVSAGTGSVQTAIAFVGTGIRRNGELILVDDQITAFVAGKHENNRGVEHERELLLPGVGEQLQNGDEVGLIFYEQHAQFAPLISVQQAPGIPGLVTLFPFPAPNLPSEVTLLTSSTAPLLGRVVLPNPYEVQLTDVGLPVFTPGLYPGSRLTENAAH